MPLGSPISNIWLTEYLSAGEVYQYLISKVLMQVQSNYQNICIVELLNNSKALLLDRQLQSTTADEFMYHEPLVHVPLVSQQNPQNVLIIGAGEGAAAREVLKWQSVESVTLVDLDKLVVDNCVHYLPEMSQGSFKNRKVKTIFCDAREFVAKDNNKYDVIIYDLCTPVQDSKENPILSKCFLMDCKTLLNKNGYMCIQSGEITLQKNEVFLNQISLMRSVFHSIKLYCSWVPSFCRNWSFVLLSKNKSIETKQFEEINRIINKQITNELLFFNAKSYIGLMNPPKYIQEYEANI